MEFSTLWVAFIETCALFGPFLLPIASLYWFGKALKLWDAYREADETIAYLIGSQALMYLAVDYSISVIRAPESSALQDFAVIVTGVSVLILLDGIYQRVRGFIKARRASS